MNLIISHFATILLIIAPTTTAFSPRLEFSKARSISILSKQNNNDSDNSHLPTRHDFIATTTTSLITGSFLSLLNPNPALARGRATFEQTYERYSPRIIAGGKFYSSDLKSIISSNDWKGLKAATSDPPKKTKADRTKPDGGVAERAAQAGGFSDARVLVAMDLYASSFSDNTVSAKTKAMQDKVEALRKVVNEMNSVAKQALGEEDGGGGFFGIGKKKVNERELITTVRQLYVEGGTKWNEYVYEANEGLGVQFTKLPYLS